jgi:dienelactone hydrolase
MGRHRIHLAATALLLAGVLQAGESRIETVGGQSVVHLAGGPYERGKAHGSILAEQVHANIDQFVRRAGERDPSATPQRIDALAKRIAEGAPDDLLEEMRGIAEGSGAALADVHRLNAAPIAFPGAVGAAFGGRTLGGRLLQVSSLEAASPVDAPPVLFVLHPEKGLRSVIVGWAGCVAGPVGVNEEGVGFAAIAAPEREAGAEGIALPVAARKALAEAKSLAAATRILSATPTAGAWTAVVSDGKLPSARIVEASGENFEELGPNDSAEPNGLADAVRRSNLRLTASAAASANLSIPSSWRLTADDLKRRYDELGRFLSAEKSPISAIDAVHYLRRSAASAGRGLAPIQQVVLNASDQELWIARAGRTQESAGTFVGYRLADLFAGRPLEKLVRIDSPSRPLDSKAFRVARETVRPPARTEESEIPEMYRMDSKPFRVESSPLGVAGGILSTYVKIPSPVETEHPENNTIPAEIFHPRGEGPFPYVIVTHIAGGDFDLSRFVSRTLASNGIACVFIKLPYYGERRPPGKNVRMLAPDVGIASGAMGQAVKDIRRVCDWIQTRPDLDGDKIGICGISLGSITGALAIAIEPRITHACLIIGGGSLADLVFESVEGEAREYRRLWTESGGTRESLQEVMKPFDPVTYPDRLRRRVILMINAEQDESVPVVCNKALWEAAGKQRIVWYPCGHYTIVQYLMPALQETVKFFREWPDREQNLAVQ